MGGGNAAAADPTPLPTPQPITPAPTNCEDRKFHYSVSEGCTNAESAAPDAVMFDTLEQCCIVEYPNPAEECLSTDICAPTPEPTSSPTPEPTPGPTTAPTSPPVTLAPTGCEQRKFYYTAATGCTNEESAEPVAVAFDTLEQCCIVRYPNPAEECISTDICAPTSEPTSSPTPKPTPTPTPKPTSSPVTPAPTRCEEREFHYTPLGGCTNEDGAEPGAVSFKTLDQCCIVHYPNPVEECVRTDVCAPAPAPEPVSTPVPTPHPTEAPVTKDPTLSVSTHCPCDNRNPPEKNERPCNLCGDCFTQHLTLLVLHFDQYHQNAARSPPNLPSAMATKPMSPSPNIPPLPRRS